MIYLHEIAPRDARFAVPTAVIFLPGAALGAAWALLLGPVVADSLVPRLATSLTNGGVPRPPWPSPRPASCRDHSI